ncbi:MAG: type II toxin-antitoxin system Y4mF family antitoxin [Thermodesulfobacteriota bacterium]
MHNRAVRTTEDLAALIKAKRLEDGLTQDDVAAFLGLGRRFVVELEQGKQTVRLSKVLEVLEGLGLELTLSSRAGEDP